jgi:hypothetical protein
MILNVDFSSYPESYENIIKLSLISWFIIKLLSLFTIWIFAYLESKFIVNVFNSSKEPFNVVIFVFIIVSSIIGLDNPNVVFVFKYVGVNFTGEVTIYNGN